LISLPSGIAPASGSFLRGMFLAHASSVWIAASRHGMEEIANRRKHMSMNVALQQGSHDAATSLLTLVHEREHYRQVTTTPLGLLMWRAVQCLLVDTDWMLRMLAFSGVHGGLFAPLTLWYSERGRDLLAAHPPLPPQEYLDVVERRAEGYGQWALEETQYVAESLDTVRGFLHALMDEKDLPMEKFIRTANLAYPVIAHRSGLENRINWDTRLPASASHLPEPRFSITEIIEAGARLKELEVLKQVKSDTAFVQEWYRQNIHGVYGPAFQWLITEVGDPFIARVAIDMACTTPLDLACASEAERVLLVEETHPSWRLVKLVSALKQRYWPGGEAEQIRAVLEDVAVAAGVPTPASAVQSLVGRALTVDADWGGKDIVVRGEADDQFDLTFRRYFAEAERRFHFSFAQRAKNPISIMGRGDETQELLPFIEFLADDAWLNGIFDEHLDDAFFVNTYRMVIGNLAKAAMLDDGDITLVIHLERGFKARARRRLSEFPDYDPMAVGPLVDGLPQVVDRQLSVETCLRSQLGGEAAEYLIDSNMAEPDGQP
jgi:hypothetical protein